MRGDASVAVVHWHLFCCVFARMIVSSPCTRRKTLAALSEEDCIVSILLVYRTASMSSAVHRHVLLCLLSAVLACCNWHLALFQPIQVVLRYNRDTSLLFARTSNSHTATRTDHWH